MAGAGDDAEFNENESMPRFESAVLWIRAGGPGIQNDEMINGKAVIKFNAPSPPATPHRADGLIHARARAFRKTNARGFYDVPPFFLFFFFRFIS